MTKWLILTFSFLLFLLSLVTNIFINQGRNVFVGGSNINIAKSINNITFDNNIYKQNKDKVKITFKNVKSDYEEVKNIDVLVYPIYKGSEFGKRYRCEKGKGGDYVLNFNLEDFKLYTGDYVALVYFNGYKDEIDKVFFSVVDSLNYDDFYTEYNNDEYFDIYLKNLAFDLDKNIQDVTFKVWVSGSDEIQYYKAEKKGNDWVYRVFLSDFDIEKSDYKVYAVVGDSYGKKHKISKSIDVELEK